MKLITRTLLYCILIVILNSCSYAADTDTIKQFAVLELYTSEGCSSCPAAEQLLPAFAEQYGDDLYILEFHVDYWNKLGWTDRFSKSSFSKRQGSYTAAFNTNNVYTPQAIVNGKAHVSGGNKRRLTQLINSEIYTNNKTYHLKLSATEEADDNIRVSFSTTLSPNEHLHLALVQAEASTQVKAGENKGKSMIHHNIVRDFKTVMYETGTQILHLPKDAFVHNCYIIAYVQNASNMHITNVVRVNID